MSSKLFNYLGIGGVDIGYLFAGLLVFCIILLILCIIAFVQIRKFKKKYNKFMLGKDGNSLETDIMTLYEDNQFIKASIDTNRENIKKLFNRQESAFQKMGLIKYDAFKEMGGKMSFALALLDENDNGFLINSLHSSDGCYSYTKRIKGGESELALSKEEQVAVERAVSGLTPDAE